MDPGFWAGHGREGFVFTVPDGGDIDLDNCRRSGREAIADRSDALARAAMAEPTRGDTDSRHSPKRGRL